MVWKRLRFDKLDLPSIGKTKSLYYTCVRTLAMIETTSTAPVVLRYLVALQGCSQGTLVVRSRPACGKVSEFPHLGSDLALELSRPPLTTSRLGISVEGAFEPPWVNLSLLPVNDSSNVENLRINKDILLTKITVAEGVVWF